jgi:hypothetical protein
MTELKKCKDCAYCRPDVLMQILSLGFDNGLYGAKCVREQPNKYDLVSGNKCKPTLCSSERISYRYIDTCGENAKYWEARK